MKKLTVLLTGVLFSLTAFTQGSIDNEVYFRFGFSLPSWKQFGGTEADWQNAGNFKRKGFMGEVGTIFMLKSIPLPDGMAIGVNPDYLSVYWNQFTDDEAGNKRDFRTLRLDSKVGPSFTYSPVNKIAFDVYVKADINWFTGTIYTVNDDTDNADIYGDFMAIGLSTGINVRLSVVMLGFEFNTLSSKLENSDDLGTYVGNFMDMTDNGDKSKLPCFNFSLGFSF